MCTIADTKEQKNHNCFNMYFYECLILGTIKTKQQLQHKVTTAVNVLLSLPHHVISTDLSSQPTWRDSRRPLDYAFPLTRLPVAFRGDKVW